MALNYFRTYTDLRDFLDRYTDALGTIQGDPATIAAEAVGGGRVLADEEHARQFEEDYTEDRGPELQGDALDVHHEEISVADRLEELRAAIRAERISYGEIAELQGLAGHIAPEDVELREWAGLPEHEASTAGASLPPAGARVRLRGDVERFPHFVAPKGAVGTVVDPGDDQIVFSVRLDERVVGAESWGNEIHWHRGNAELNDMSVAEYVALDVELMWLRGDVELLETGVPEVLDSDDREGATDEERNAGTFFSTFGATFGASLDGLTNVHVSEPDLNGDRAVRADQGDFVLYADGRVEQAEGWSEWPPVPERGRHEAEAEAEEEAAQVDGERNEDGALVDRIGRVVAEAAYSAAHAELEKVEGFQRWGDVDPGEAFEMEEVGKRIVRSVLLNGRVDAPAPPRTILVHLNVEVPAHDDTITTEDVEREIRDALEIAAEGGNAPALAVAIIEVPLAEEI